MAWFCSVGESEGGEFGLECVGVYHYPAFPHGDGAERLDGGVAVFGAVYLGGEGWGCDVTSGQSRGLGVDAAAEGEGGLCGVFD